MPVYNSERFLTEAIESMLAQVFQDFELIVVADKSTDRTDEILKLYEGMDPRIKVYRQEREGLVASLNRGCGLTRGKYIARMDADDRSLPQRLEEQVNYLETHPCVGILGTWIRYIDEAGHSGKVVKSPTNPKLIGWYLHFENCLNHPTVMMRRETVERLGFYRMDAIHAEDYDLWTRAIKSTQIAVLPEPLLEYRIWRGSICFTNTGTQNQTVIRIRHSMISELLGPEIPVDAIVTPPDMAGSSFLEIAHQIRLVGRLMLRIYPAYSKAASLNLLESIMAAYYAGRIFKHTTKEILITKVRPLCSRI